MVIPGGPRKLNCLPLEPDWGSPELRLAPCKKGAGREELLQRLKRAAVLGLGGGAFPLWRKLEQRLDLILINFASYRKAKSPEAAFAEEEEGLLARSLELLGRLQPKARLVAAGSRDSLFSAFPGGSLPKRLEAMETAERPAAGSEIYLFAQANGVRLRDARARLGGAKACAINPGTLISAVRAVEKGECQLGRYFSLEEGEGVRIARAKFGEPLKHIFGRLGLGETEAEVFAGGHRVRVKVGEQPFSHQLFSIRASAASRP